MCEADEVLAYWLADAASDPAACAARRGLWFMASEETDAAIAARFGAQVAEAEGGGYEAWCEDARARLGLIVLLDQFPRNLYRGTARAFACDARALTIAEDGLEAGHFDALRTLEQVFFLMPFEHSEDVAVQRRGIALFQRVVDEAAPDWKTLARDFAEYARTHFAIIERFGRYPHRNAVLGRESTAEERAYLEAGAETFGQG